MFECRKCGQKNKRISSHISRRHKMSVFDYLKKYENIDCCELYKDGFSAQQISNLIKGGSSGIRPLKAYVLDYLRTNGVTIRDTSTATKEWIKKIGGPWNKGKTKEDHPSIKKYADSRRGKSNPYYTGTDDSRERTRYWEYKSEEELTEIRQKAGDTLKERYRSGELIPLQIKDPSWGEMLLKKRMAGYRKWLKSNNKVKFGNISNAEREIAQILEDQGIKYVKQFSPAGRMSYDFYIPDTNVVLEYNGTYWHCDPRKYDKDYFNQRKNKTAEEMWIYDKKKIDFIESMGYDVRVLWEEDYKRLTREEKRKLILETIKN